MASPQQPSVESLCVAPKPAQATLSFEITGYSQHRGRGLFIRSSSVDVGGYSWCLRYYPDGDGREHTKGFVLFYLELLTKNVEVKAFPTFRLINVATAAGSPCVLYYHGEETPACFSTADVGGSGVACWGVFGKFQKHTELESSVYLHDDRLVIECDITVVEPLVVVAMGTSVVEELRGNLSMDFGKLLESKEGADVTFVVQGEVVAAHTIVLAARSPVFKAELYRRPSRKQSGEHREITIEDIHPDVFKALLHFIYTDTMSPCINSLDGAEKRDLTKDLLVVADRYNVGGLRSVCETNLCESLDVSTVATTLAFADQHRCAKLKDACVKYMASNDMLDDLVASNGYDRLKWSCLTIFADLFEKLAKSVKFSFVRPRHV